MKKKTERYTNHHIQNELLKLMSVNVLRAIARNLQTTDFITIMMDECTDIANQEQVQYYPFLFAY